MQGLRRQILKDLGIVPWQLRRTASAAATPPTAPVDAAIAPTPESVDRRPPNAQPTDAATARRAATAPAGNMAGAGDVTRSRESVRTGESWSALSLVAGGVLVLVEGDISRRDRRFVRDVLAAAAGDWQKRPVGRRFDWPSAGAGTASSAARALAAFVDKDVADHGVRLVLCSEALADRLAEAWGANGPRRLLLPPLERLSRDVAAKRTLWRQLQSARE
ncbi:MAG: hypothetical protein RIC56_03610 [Pseudomonadales bacterium]